MGNRTRLIYPHQGKEVEYQYNEANQLVKVIDWDMQETTYQYDVVGRPVTITLPNGVSTSLSYDDAGNLLSLTHQTITGTIGSYVYEYDNTGRRIGAVEIGRVMTYTYDALYRLTDAIESTGAVYHYEYDAAGNRLLKVEPGVNQAATYDLANQLLTLGGLPVLHDDNGNLVHDGEFTYTYNSLDQLISVSNGITGTLYGYNGDGDRLWQNTDGISTTFILDLNGALAQVLAQTPHTVNGATTYFVPGANGQQTQGVWSYLHTDGLGSIRHLTDATGQVLGNLRYSPFGELVEMSGPSPMFGFSGEQQNFNNNLVYLRARYYNPALGRFLTPDSLIPDITNGQSLNAYAYVYNDPINLVDPSGNIPNVGDAIVNVAKRLPASWQSSIRGGAAAGLEGVNWWYDEPNDCLCQSRGLGLPGLGPGQVGPGLGLATQGVWAAASEPAQRIGNVYVTQARPMDFMGREFWNSGKMRFPAANTQAFREISIDQTVRGWMGTRKGNVTYLSSGAADRTVVRPTSAKWVVGGMRGLVGTIGIGGLIDGVFQLYNDLDLCLSHAQRFNRFALAFGLGTLAALGGVIAFGAATFFGAPVLLTIGIGFAASVGVGVGTNYLKNRYFETFPKTFGR